MPYPLRRPLLSPSSPERLLLLDEIVTNEAQKLSPSTSCSSDSTTSSSPSPRILQPPYTTASSKPNTSTTHHLPPVTPARTLSPPSMYYFTWLVFLHEKWVPFDAANQSKLEQTLTLGGTFVDISDTHFPKVKRVRVFPKNNYLSYLGVKYRLSRIMQPDAWLDHKHLAATSSSDEAAIDNSSNRENTSVNGTHGDTGISSASPWIPWKGWNENTMNTGDQWSRHTWTTKDQRSLLQLIISLAIFSIDYTIACAYIYIILALSLIVLSSRRLSLAIHKVLSRYLELKLGMSLYILLIQPYIYSFDTQEQ